MKTKIALVTGGSRGLGKDMAFSLAKKGIDVVLTYNTSKEEAEKVENEIKDLGQKAVALQFDISDIASLDNFIVRLSFALKEIWDTDKFDFLINNAGIGAMVPFVEVTEELFDRMMNIHFKGVYFLTQKSIPFLNGDGGIVFISTGTTRFSLPGYSAYASMKGALEVLTRYVAKELGPLGIRANIVAPGAIETDFNNAALRNNPQVKSFIASQTPLGRVGRADDIGSVVSFLCTKDAKWINGQRIEVSGGING
ncbi:MAG TPA: short-chain dehydrogenase [Prolixibacteraceae bacterium]|nr:short-chain dehydrogenase [Prolixibacteraceae bacterium]